MKKVVSLFLSFFLFVALSSAVFGSSLILVYLPNSEVNGEILPVYRIIDNVDTEALIQSLLNLELNENEKQVGFFNPFEGRDPNFQVKEFQIEDEVLFVKFEDPNFWSSGGSSRVILMRETLKKNLLQLEEIKEVVFVGEALQP